MKIKTVTQIRSKWNDLNRKLFNEEKRFIWHGKSPARKKFELFIKTRYVPCDEVADELKNLLLHSIESPVKETIMELIRELRGEK